MADETYDRNYLNDQDIPVTTTTATCFHDIAKVNIPAIKNDDRSCEDFDYNPPAVFAISGSCPASPFDVGETINETIAIINGTGPYTAEIIYGALPTGLSLNDGTSVTITGTTSAAGTFSFVIQITDFLGAYDTISCEITVVPNELVITSACPTEQPILGDTYSYTFVATGGTPLYVWTATGLPNTLTINVDTGEVSGTVDESGTFPYTITCTDADMNEAHIDCEFVIADEERARPLTTSVLETGPTHVSIIVDAGNAIDNDPDTFAEHRDSASSPITYGWQQLHISDWPAPPGGYTQAVIHVDTEFLQHTSTNQFIQKCELFNTPNTAENVAGDFTIISMSTIVDVARAENTITLTNTQYDAFIIAGDLRFLQWNSASQSFNGPNRWLFYDCWVTFT